MEKTRECFTGMYVDYILGYLKKDTEPYNITMWDIDVKKEFNLKKIKELNFKGNINSDITWGSFKL